MNYSDAGIVAALAALFSGAFQWLKNLSSSKEKIALRKLDIEAKSKEYINAALLEYQEKQNEIIQKVTAQSVEISELKQVVSTLATYFKAVVEIAENNIENSQIRAVVKGMHVEADKLVSKFKTA